MVSQQSEFTIQEIVVLKSLHPVTNSQGCASHFSQYNHPLWLPEVGSIPATVNALDGTLINLRITVKSRNALEDAALYGEQGLGVKTAASSIVDTRLDSDGHIFLFDVSWDPITSGGKPYPCARPWAFNGSITWKIDGNSGEGAKAIGITPIELFAVCPAIPGFMQSEGIPATLLRFALQIQAEDPNMWSMPYDLDITERVFHSGFKYNISGGGAPSFASGAGQPFNLNKWLQTLSIIRPDIETEDNTKARASFLKDNIPTVNCYDQAGILGLCLSLGFKDEADRNALVPYFMQPFGFINATDLVGWGLCNSPFENEENGNLFMQDRKNRLRQKFGNHVFLTWRDNVYDACAGPEKGTRTLQEYIDHAIDERHPLLRKKDGSIVPENAITGTRDSAHPHTTAGFHGGILGELEVMTTRDARHLAERLALEEKPEDHKRSLDAYGFLEWFRNPANLPKKGDKITFSDPHVEKPEFWTFRDNPDGADRIGLVDWPLEVTVDGKRTSIHMEWRIFNSAAAAMNAQSSHSSSIREDDKCVAFPGKNGCVVVARHGAQTLTTRGKLDKDQLVLLTEAILNFLRDSPTTGEGLPRMQIGNIRADPKLPEKAQIIPRIRMDVGAVQNYIIQVCERHNRNQQVLTMPRLKR
jgi:hypothetical protein